MSVHCVLGNNAAGNAGVQGMCVARSGLGQNNHQLQYSHLAEGYQGENLQFVTEGHQLCHQRRVLDAVA